LPLATAVELVVTATRNQPSAQVARATSDDRKSLEAKARANARAASLCYVLSPDFTEAWPTTARELGLQGDDAELTRDRQIALALLAYEANAEGYAWTELDVRLVPMSGIGRTKLYAALHWVEKKLRMGARAPSVMRTLVAFAKHVGDRRYPAEHATLNAALETVVRVGKKKAPTTADFADLLSAAALLPTGPETEWSRELGELVNVVRAARPRAAVRSALALLASHVSGVTFSKAGKKTPDALAMDEHAAAIDRAWRDALPGGASVPDLTETHARDALERGDKLAAWLSPGTPLATRLRALVANLRAALELRESVNGIEGHRGRSKPGRTFNVRRFMLPRFRYAKNAAPMAWASGLDFLTVADRVPVVAKPPRRAAPKKAGAVVKTAAPKKASAAKVPAFDRWSLHVLLCRTANPNQATWESDLELGKLARRSETSFGRDVAALRALGIVRVVHVRKGQRLPDGEKARESLTAVRSIDFDRLQALIRCGEERSEMPAERPPVGERTSANDGENVRRWGSERPPVGEDLSRSLGSQATAAGDVLPRTGGAPPPDRGEADREADREASRRREAREERERLEKNAAFKRFADALALDETKVRQACRSLDAWLSLNGDATTAELREVAREAGGQTPQPLAPARAVLTAARALAQHATDTVLQGAAATLADALRAYDEREDAFWATVAKKKAST
jgi:hypothetical protein